MPTNDDSSFHTHQAPLISKTPLNWVEKNPHPILTPIPIPSPLLPFTTATGKMGSFNSKSERNNLMVFGQKHKNPDS